jgi:plasmid replication initiation protein
VLDFTSKYALALYENIQMRKSFNKTSFNLQEFRALMGVEEGEHTRMQNFKNIVLHPAIEEINAKSDLKLVYEDIKEGAKIVGFVFKWETLTLEQMKQRNKRREQIEGYQKALAANMGEKFKIGGKWYTLTKQGFVNRGKVLGGIDIVDSYETYKKLEQQGLVTEKKDKAQSVTAKKTGTKPKST